MFKYFFQKIIFFALLAFVTLGFLSCSVSDSIIPSDEEEFGIDLPQISLEDSEYTFVTIETAQTAQTGSIVGIPIVATIENASGTLEYIIDCDAFDIDSSTGQIVVSSERLEIGVVTCEVEVRYNDISETIRVFIDVRDAKLAFNLPSYDFNISDTAAVGSLVSEIVSATTIEDDVIEYSFDDDCTAFSVDTETAQISVAKLPTVGSTTCTITASVGNVETSVSVSILVSTTVRFVQNPYMFSTITAATTGTTVSSVSASTTGVDPIVYSFDGVCANYDIDSITGEITVSSAPLSVGMISCDLLASVGSVQDRSRLVIVVTGSTLSFDATLYSFVPDTGASSGDAVGVVVATASTTDYSVVYSFDGTCANYDIDSITGEITVSSAPLSVGMITCTARATVGAIFTTIDVNISVEEPLYFPQSTYTLDIGYLELIRVSILARGFNAISFDPLSVITYTFAGDNRNGDHPAANTLFCADHYSITSTGDLQRDDGTDDRVAMGNPFPIELVADYTCTITATTVNSIGEEVTARANFNLNLLAENPPVYFGSLEFSFDVRFDLESEPDPLLFVPLGIGFISVYPTNSNIMIFADPSDTDNFLQNTMYCSSNYFNFDRSGLRISTGAGPLPIGSVFNCLAMIATADGSSSDTTSLILTITK